MGRRSRQIERREFLSRKLQVVVVFALAGLLSACIYNAYAARVEKLYNALPSQYTDTGITASSHEKWYQANNALVPYADRKWSILCLGFPIAMTLAMSATSLAGWLGNFSVEKKIAGLILVYFAPGMVLYLSGVSWFLLLIPTLGIAAFLLAVSLAIITTKWSARLFLGFLLGGAASALCWFHFVNHGDKASQDTAWNVSFLLLEMLWGGLYGFGLTVPGRVLPPPRPPVFQIRAVNS